MAGVLFLYLLQRLQGVLPGSLGFASIDPDQAFNTAVSFVTNTNWQSYYGEQAMGHVVQTAGLAVENFGVGGGRHGGRRGAGARFRQVAYR
ncbi:Potassium-transporting ATPase potassium-binding subunit [Streptomyces hirsutus]